jgi:subtilisin-like proprotein convertase family protein
VNCTTYTSTNVPLAIGPGAGLTSSTITVPGNPRIADLDVNIQLNHTRMADLDVHLRAPANPSDANNNGLFTDIGAAAIGGQAQMDLTLDDEAGIPINIFTVMRPVSVKPELNYRLNWFDGQDAGGTWTLDLYDDSAAEGGTLTGWSLTICEQPAVSGTQVYSENFDGGGGTDGGFTHSGTADEWERGTPATVATTTANPVAGFTACNSGTNCWKTDLDNTYNVSSSQDLLSPNINLSTVGGPVTLEWAMRYQMESASFDHARVIVQQVGLPATARTVWEFYDGTMTNVPGNPTVNVPAAAGWGRYRADISSFAGQNIEVIFHLDSDTTVQFGGMAIDDVAVYGSVGTPATAGQLLISEFRVRGPSGANDEFIEIYNNSGADHTVAGANGGYGIAASDGLTRCTIPNGTVIPNRGHFLCANAGAYSLAGYAPADATGGFVDIPDNAGIALFNNNTGGGSYSLANRIDAVGSTSEANTLYKEGTGYPALTPFSIDYAFVRDNCGKQGSITTFGGCPSGGLPVDTDNNATDFYFVDTNGTSAGAGQRLGAPGPENLASPIQRNSVFGVVLLDNTVSPTFPPNRVRDFTSDPANNSTFGTLDIRRRVVNNTGGNVTRLRFRVIDLTTFPAPSGIADLRPRTSTLVVVSGINDAGTCLASNGVATTPCTVNVQGTTLEQPPSQPNGGGFNSTLSAGTITLGTPLANGASINVRFLLGIQQTGSFKFFINVEALP